MTSFQPSLPLSHWLIFGGGASLAANWHLSRPIRGGCTSSSSLTRTPPAGCVCCSWPYSSPFVSAGFTVRRRPHRTWLCLLQCPRFAHKRQHNASPCNHISPLPSTGGQADTHTRLCFGRLCMTGAHLFSFSFFLNWFWFDLKTSEETVVQKCFVSSRNGVVFNCCAIVIGLYQFLGPLLQRL